MATREQGIAGKGTGPRESKGESGRLTRRALLRRLGLGTAAVVGLSYVKPSLLNVTVAEANDVGRYEPTPTPTPTPPPPGAGLTPGYWKNWRNKYTDAQFLGLLAGTIANNNIARADAIFDEYNASPGKEMTILRAFLLTVQLTIALVSSGLPVPDGVNLSPSAPLPGGGTLADAISDALSLEGEYPYSASGVSSGDRSLALNTKDRLATLLTV